MSLPPPQKKRCCCPNTVPVKGNHVCRGCQVRMRSGRGLLQCLTKRELRTGATQSEDDIRTRGGCPVVAAMLRKPRKATGSWRPPETRERRGTGLPRSLRERTNTWVSVSGLQVVRQHVAVVLSLLVGGAWLRQPRQSRPPSQTKSRFCSL